MASKRIEMCTVLQVLVLMLWNGAKAQSGCSNAIMSLSPCLTYVTGNVSTPSSSCCTQLAGVVQSTPRCLCSLMNGAGNPMNLNINQTLALTLPGACNVQTPPVSQCNAVVNGPASSPATSPASSTPDVSNTTPENPTTTPANPTPSPTIPSGTASKTVPTTTGSPSDGNLTKPAAALFLFLAALASTIFHF
ncbi:hypothetical protein ACH5RR_010645 [Cinchona calisaya]|uniref:Bifunctional inhibitor/plant lipid transfer protein/seed storage helical domain-containing protein n=1 Tax=Cinchona calisaya TaxID=153742 RepID=A0ABD3AJJ0_9GENT